MYVYINYDYMYIYVEDLSHREALLGHSKCKHTVYVLCTCTHRVHVPTVKMRENCNPHKNTQQEMDRTMIKKDYITIQYYKIKQEKSNNVTIIIVTLHTCMKETTTRKKAHTHTHPQQGTPRKKRNPQGPRMD